MAVLVLLDSISKQLALPKGNARVLFVDFSAAFNSMKLHILLQRLANINSLDQRLSLMSPSEGMCKRHFVRSAYHQYRLPTRQRSFPLAFLSIYK